tara:strand:- start:147 stop:959 length:813 start_codon:yes stop_codon:yes gene_type:complete
VSDLWHTTLSAIQRGEPDWQAIATYESPVRRYLARRFRALPGSERDDLLQEILLAMRERVVPGYQAEVGSFRSFLAVSIHNAVRDHLRRQRPSKDLALEEHRLEDLAEGDLEAGIPEAEVLALDLEARLLAAVRAVHDRYARGAEADLSLVYVLSGALVNKLSNKEIAKREGLSSDQVKRKLQRLRGEILSHLFGGLLPGLPRSEAARCADLARQCLRTPRQEARLLEDSPHAEVVAALTAAVRGAQRVLGASESDEDLDLVAGIHAIFQ